MINELEPHQIIVVGTNSAGIHAGGAAAQAHRHFGALMGCAAKSIGGQSYGIVTLDFDMKRVSPLYLASQAEDLRTIAFANPDKEFLLTPIGTGIAGFDIKMIEEIFTNLPENIRKVGW